MKLKTFGSATAWHMKWYVDKLSYKITALSPDTIPV